MTIGLELEGAYEALLHALSEGDYRPIVRSLTNELLKIGDPVPPELVLGVHSTCLCEDGFTVVRMFDLASGRTGIQYLADADRPGQMHYAD